MASEPNLAVAILEYMVWLVWSCLSEMNPKLKNPVFDMVLTSSAVIAQLMSSSLVVFAPGLLDVLLSETPPTVAYFMSLPKDIEKRWAVYLLVLTKLNCRPRIYIGSGTAKKRGVALRFYQYDQKIALPCSIERTLNEGYTIASKGLLCWAPVPSALIRFPLRALFLAIESVLSLALWAMVSRSKDYGMPHLCPWDLSTMEYDGCCNHIAFIERVNGEEEGLTVEQIAEKQKEMDERQKLQSKITHSTAYFSFKLRDFAGWQAQRRKYTTQRSRDSVKASKKKSGAKAKATGQYRCEPCGKSFEGINALDAHKRTNVHRDKVNGVKKTVKLPYNKAWVANNKATKRYHCGTCNKTFNNSTHLNDHNNTDTHIDKVNGTTFHCGPCKRDFDTRRGLDSHNRQPGHLAKIAELAEASS
jgi:DNA-directed RNA polymerase subunit RPC12/RpoP